MKIKMLIFFLVAVVAIIGPPQVKATTIHLDGISNAGWSMDDLTKAHLYIADVQTGNYYYQWIYAPNNPVPWNSREVLANDLRDGVLFNGTANEISVPNWQVQSAGDVFNNPANAIWKELSISPGTYTLKLTADSHAYQLNEFLWPNENNSSPVWNAYVQMYAVYDDTSKESFNFGDWNRARGTENSVLALYRQDVDGLIVNITKPAMVYFYINDYNSVDNGGSVTLEFTDPPPPVPLPGSLLLFGSGLAAFLVRRRR
jgi:hypothetical protein